MNTEGTGTFLYFAYGSNMYEQRLRARAPSAHYYDIARLPAHYLAFRKEGADGSGKCDLAPFDPETVWGVVYCVDEAEREDLDAAEGEGYCAITATVASGEGFLDVHTYQARPGWYTDALPFSWYRELVAAGARQHGLPELYVAAIEEMDAVEDPDADRAARNRP